MKILIVGGVAGGAGAATKLRRLDETAEIIMFEKGAYISYANCGLPYYIGRIIKEEANLVVTQPELLRERFNIDVRTHSEVTSIDRANKKVTVLNHQTGESYSESYDKLLLSPGAEPKKPPLEGIELPGIFTLRTVNDTLAIHEYINQQKARRAVIVGAGFIGIEMAENLRQRGLEVTIVEFLDQIIASLDPEMAAIGQLHLQEKGVKLLLGTGVQGFSKAEPLLVHTNNGESLAADLVILSIGVSPESTLAQKADLEIGPGKSISVDAAYTTSDPDIFAVGDAINVPHLVSKQQVLLPLAGPANKQGRNVAENILNLDQHRTPAVQGSAILKVFDLTAASTGLNEKQLKSLNIPFLKTYIHPANHATYYPGATTISLKLLFTPEGKLLGAQGIGYTGVDKRIDVLATALRLGATVYDLEELELCYAPPYSSAKDPVNMLGFTAANILRGTAKVFHYDEVAQLDPDKTCLLDVRTVEEAEQDTLPGALLIPLDELRQRLQELPKQKPIYVYCAVGLRGYLAQRILSQLGFEAYNLSGGYVTYWYALAANQKS